MIFDFHCHNTIRPYHTIDKDTKKQPNRDHWNLSERTTSSEKRYTALVKLLSRQLAIENQTHFKAYHKGDVRCVCTALYPLEQGFTVVRALPTIIANLGFLIDEEKLVAAVIGLSESAVKIVNQTNYDYFTPLIKETENLVQGAGLPNRYAPGKSYDIAQNFSQVEQIKQDPKRVAVILSVEGAHAFISRNLVPPSVDLERESKKTHSAVMDQVVLQMEFNIKAFKTKYPLFIVTFAHHFYNLLCGHAPSVPKLIFNQKGGTYFKRGISNYGLKIIELFLDKKPRRVLIDTKHMSYRSRIDYHDLVRQKNASGDDIPIIQTHTAVAGRPSMRELSKKFKGHKANPAKWEKDDPAGWPQGFRRQFQKTTLTWTINLFDDEILEIVNSQGLIGIMLDEKRILGKRLPSYCDRIHLTFDNGAVDLLIDPAETDLFRYQAVKAYFAKCCFKVRRLERKLAKASDADKPARRIELRDAKLRYQAVRTMLRSACCAIFLNQLLYMARVVGDAKIYHHVCLGTDFDGVINSLDAYPDGSFLTEFQADLKKFWKHKINLGEQDFIDLKFNRQVDAIIDDLFWKNAERFLKKYFKDGYLKALV